MKAISLWQPHATLMAIGSKKNETRSWYTDYRGPLIIQAAKRFTSEERHLCAIQPFREHLKREGYMVVARLPFGRAVCVVDLIDVVPTESIVNSISSTEKAFGDYSPGRFAWITDNVRKLPDNISMKGYQQLWTPLQVEVDMINTYLSTAHS